MKHGNASDNLTEVVVGIEPVPGVDHGEHGQGVLINDRVDQEGALDQHNDVKTRPRIEAYDKVFSDYPVELADAGYKGDLESVQGVSILASCVAGELAEVECANY